MLSDGRCVGRCWTETGGGRWRQADTKKCLQQKLKQYKLGYRKLVPPLGKLIDLQNSCSPELLFVEASWKHVVTQTWCLLSEKTPKETFLFFKHHCQQKQKLGFQKLKKFSFRGCITVSQIVCGLCLHRVGNPKH